MILNNSRLFALLIISIMLTGPALAANGADEKPPPQIAIPESALKGRLGPEHISQIEQRITYWAELMAKAEGSNATRDIISSRNGIIGDFRAYDTPSYGYAFAREAARILAGVLNNGFANDDPNLRLKEVNLAIAISQISQVPIQDALDEMVVHRNAGVRYLGWLGYRNIRSRLLAQGSNFSQKMFETLQKQAAAESSPAVLGELIQMLYFPPEGIGSVSPAVLSNARNKCFNILSDNWSNWCEKLFVGEAEMAWAINTGVETLLRISTLLADDKKAQTNILQMITNTMHCSSLAYDAAFAITVGKGETSRVNAVLLLNCEMALSEISGNKLDNMKKALDKPDEPGKAAGVRLAVLDWIDALKANGVVKPEFKLPDEKEEEEKEADGTDEGRTEEAS